MPVYLHVFEERYRAMIQRILKTDRTFGVVLIHKGEEALGPIAQPYSIGCLAHITHTEPYPDGRLDLTAVGEERFRIHSLDWSQPYLVGKVETFPLEKPRTLSFLRSARQLRSQVTRYIQQISLLNAMLNSEKDEMKGNLEADPEIEVDLSEIDLPEDPLMLTHLAASLLQIPAREKQPILESLNAEELIARVERLYHREISILPALMETSNERARRSAWLN